MIHPTDAGGQIREPDSHAQAIARTAQDEMRSPDAMIDTIPIPAITPAAAARFTAKVTYPDGGDGCHEWGGYLDRGGYGQFKIDGRMYRPHRVAWAWRYGRIPPGLSIDHLCRNRSCVNPAHLEPKSIRENTLAGDTINADHAARNHCPRGHELVAANLRPAHLRRGERECRICSAIWSRARNDARRRGGDLEEQRAAGTAAVDALTGDETLESVGLAPLPIHYALGLIERQLRLPIGASR